MPLVFVHGVSTRRGPGFDGSVAARDALFRRFLLPAVSAEPESVTILNPYWGDHGARPAWNHASLPAADVEALGAEDLATDQEMAALVGAAIPPDDPITPKAPLVATARRSVEDAIDLLWAGAAENPGKLSELSRSAQRAVRYARQNTDWDWLNSVETDDDFLLQLEAHVEAWEGPRTEGPEAPRYESLGFSETWDRLREAADRIRGVVGRVSGRAVAEVARGPAHRAATLFLGDILVYLRERGTRDQPGPIMAEVSGALEEAARSATDADRKLIVVAHSMGGNIVYDALTHFRPDIPVDVLVTVGSQVAFFEELKLFAASDNDIPRNPATDRVRKPSGVGRWINIFDRNDVLGFVAEGVFAGVEDYEYSTGEGIFLAHMTYFTRPSFHDRLGERVGEPAP
jgi:hypothetical protein